MEGEERELDQAAWEAELKQAMHELRRQAFRERQARSARQISPWVM